MIIANKPSLGVLLSSDQDQADMTSVVAIMIVFLIIGIAVDALTVGPAALNPCAAVFLHSPEAPSESPESSVSDCFS